MPDTTRERRAEKPKDKEKEKPRKRPGKPTGEGAKRGAFEALAYFLASTLLIELYEALEKTPIPDGFEVYVPIALAVVALGGRVLEAFWLDEPKRPRKKDKE